MAKRNNPRRSRSRRRSGRQSTAAAGSATATATPPSERSHSTRPAKRAPSAQRSRREPGGFGERPQAPWHPLPLAELMILVGMIATVVGAFSKDILLLGVGLGVVLVGTLDFSIREHLSGYRAHSSLLAAVPTALVHGIVAVAMRALGTGWAPVIAVPLAIDIPLFWGLFRLFRGRYEDARRERVFAARS